jgi:hypothetical protein
VEALAPEEVLRQLGLREPAHRSGPAIWDDALMPTCNVIVKRSGGLSAFASPRALIVIDPEKA